jgi:PAS domain S-box-containing protein
MNDTNDNTRIYEVLFETNPQPMLIFDLETLAFLAVNNAAQSLYGYSIEEFLSKTIKDIRPEEDVGFLMDVLDRYRTEYQDVGAVRHLKKDGTILHVMLQIHNVQWRGRQARHVMITDITKIIHLENSLEQSQSKLKILFDTMAQGVVFQNSKGEIIDFNKAAEHILGLSYSQLIGKNTFEANWKALKGDGSPIRGEDHPAIVALNTGEPVNDFEMGLYNPILGKHIWILVSCIPLTHEGDGHPHQVYSSFTDITAQKELEQNLSLEITRRKILFNMSIDGMVILGSNRSVLECNESFANMLGYSVDEVMQLKVWDWDDVYDSEEKTLGDYPELPKESGYMATRARRKDKTVIDVEVTWVPIEWDAHQNLFCIYRDVTVRNAAERNLRLSEERFQKIFNSTPAAISVLDPVSGQIKDINPSFERLYECTREEAVGKTAQELGILIDSEDMSVIVNRVNANVSKPNYTSEGKTRTGRHLYLMHAIEKTSFNDNEYLIASTIDITQQKVAEIALRKSEEKYKFITEMVDDVIWILDLSTNKFEYVSPSVHKLRGYTPEEVMAESLDKALTPESNLKVKALLESNIPLVMAGQPEVSSPITEIDQPTKSGNIVHTEVATKVLLSPEGLPSKVIGASRDISFRKKVEKHFEDEIRLLDICNNSSTANQLIERVIVHLKEMCKCENASMMVKIVAGIPQVGLTKNQDYFIRTVDSQLADHVWSLPSADGSSSDTCFCINVMNGYESKNKQCSTSFGSFWTNAKTQLFNCEQPCVRSDKKHCVFTTQESIAWFPIKTGSQFIGMLQLDDKKPDFFSEALIAEIESMVNYIGISLSKINAEQELKESSLFLKQVIKGANEGIIVVDAEQNIKVWNTYLSRITGIPDSETLGENAVELFRSIGNTQLKQRIERTLKGEIPEPIEYTIYNKKEDCTIVAWEVLTPLTNVKGTINGVIGIIRDITDRKKAETAAETFSRLYATLSQVNQAIARNNNETELFQIICDVAIEFGKFSLAWIGEYNANSNTIIPIASSSIQGVYLPFTEIELSQPPFNEGLTNKTIQSKDVVFCKDIHADSTMAHWQPYASNGEYHSVAAIPLFRNNDVMGVFSLYAPDVDFFNSQDEADLIREMGLDISFALDAIDAHKKREATDNVLKQTTERLSLATSAAQIGVWDWDISKQTIIWDSQMEVIYEMDSSIDVNYDDWFNFVVGEDRELFQMKIKESLEQSELGECEYRIATNNGNIKYVRSAWRVMRDQYNCAQRMIGISIDVTERKQAIVDRIEREAAEQANRAKSEFLANVSHEIRTPMNAIIGYSELLHQTLRDNKQLMQADSILSSSKSLLNIINDLLDISKIEAGKMDLEFDFFDIHHLLKEIKQLFTAKAAEKNLLLDMTIDDDVPKALFVDETRMGQILINLIGNSIKFTHVGRVYVQMSAKIKSGSTTDITIQVGDTGIGIPIDEQQHVFNPFYQITGQAKRKYGGTGLGLAIAQRYVEMMHGSITIKSEVNKGTVFTIFLPNISYSNDSVTTSVATNEDINLKFNSSTVLVADDNEVNRNLLGDILEHYSLKVVYAKDGKEAFQMAQEYQPDLILLDLRMPEMNGVEAAERLRQNNSTSSIPIVAISASPEISHTSQVKSKLFDDYLTKPILIPKLVLSLKRYLDFTYDPRSEFVTAVIPEGDEKMVLTDELRTNLKRLIKSLETKYTFDYEQTKLSPSFEQIENFGRELELLGLTMGSDYLSEYGKNMSLSAERQDIDASVLFLDLFPNIVEDIKALQTD